MWRGPAARVALALVRAHFLSRPKRVPLLVHVRPTSSAHAPPIFVLCLQLCVYTAFVVSLLQIV